MNRMWAVFACDFKANLKRPFFWIWYALLALNAWLLSTGNWIIRSVDTSVGTQKSFVNSEFQIAFAFALFPFLMLGIFMAISAGTTILRDTQWRVGEIIHTTPLRPAEYVWGKFLAVLASAFFVLGLFVLTLFFLNEIVPHPGSEIHGPMRFRNYVLPALVFILPALTWTAATAFALGIFTRRSAVVYLFPVVMLLLAMNFLYAWYPPDATPLHTYVMQVLDPSGFRWLKQTWFKVDRGVGFYNLGTITYDARFLAGRIFYMLLSVALVALSSRRFARRFARIQDDPRASAKSRTVAATPVAEIPQFEPAKLVSSRKPAAVIRQILSVAYFELKELASQPWLFVFIAFISLVFLMADPFSQGDLHIQSLYTSGLIAVDTFTQFTLLICFLLMFTIGESFAREGASGLSPLYYSTPVRTRAIVLGKAAAGFFVALFALLISFITVGLFIVSQNEAPLQLTPFVQIWGALMLPTFVFWIALCTASYALTKSRFGTYGVGIAVLFLTGWMIFNDKSTWLTNWPLATSLVWSDFGPFDLDRKALILNRLFYLALSGSLFAIALRAFPRRIPDGRIQRVATAPRRAVRILSIALFVLLPALIGVVLWLEVENGFEGTNARNREKNYWRQNVATYWRAPLPDRTFVDMDLRFEPSQRSFTVRGFYDLINNQEATLYRFPVSGTGDWRNLKWTLNGKAAAPENRSALYIFHLDTPMAPKQTLRLGFSYEGTMLPGVSRNGGQLELGEFILPSGIVLTGRNPRFVPVLGFQESIGIDDENRHEPEDPDPHFYDQVISGGVDRSMMNTRIRIDVPESFLVTSMGVATSEQVSGGRRLVVWESDYPVRVFNVVAGHWKIHNGRESTIYHKAEHTRNIDQIQEALDGSRHYYSEWFGRYPWKQLRLSEFPGISLYARGNPTNIFFSENIGFLTRDNMNDTISFGLNAFGITAHEAAHQWWGHMLSPGDAPGGIVLAEGMANFSVMCLLEQMKGEKMRQAFSRSIELYYGENRFVSSERSLARTTSFRPADTTVIYDKGSWVFWMMRNLMGKEAMYAGLKSFIQKYHSGLDRPVSEDFVAHMREYAPDPAAYDRFTKQWFFEVSIPEYRYLKKPEKRAADGGWDVTTRIKNMGRGTMPVQIAALGDDPDSQKAIVTITLGPDEEQDLRIHCNFEPERLVVDPDVNVLQLQRNATIFHF